MLVFSTSWETPKTLVKVMLIRPSSLLIWVSLVFLDEQTVLMRFPTASSALTARLVSSACQATCFMKGSATGTTSATKSETTSGHWLKTYALIVQKAVPSVIMLTVQSAVSAKPDGSWLLSFSIRASPLT